MKLGTLRTDAPDGRLVVVDRDLRRFADASDLAPNLQTAIDDWPQVSRSLEDRYRKLCDDGVAGAQPLSVAALDAPLPRAYQFIDGSAYVRHAELLRRARGAELPERFWTDPLVYQACSNPCLAAADPIRGLDPDWGIDFEAELVTVTDRVPQGIDSRSAREHMKLFMLVNDVSLRGLIPEELAKGFGFLHGKPPSAFSPVAVTADEFGDAWDGETVALPLCSTLRGAPFGHPVVSVDQTFSLAQLIAHCATTRPLCAGTIIGTGTVSNGAADAGFSCIAEARASETIAHGAPRTRFLGDGDRVRIEMLDARGCSIFGAIDHRVEAPRTGASQAP